MKPLLIAIVLLLLTGCATKQLPIPEGTPIKINTPDEVQEMLAESDVKLIGPRSDEPNVRRYFSHNPMMLLSREPDPDEFMQLGAMLVKTTVTINFASGAVDFVLTESERFHIRQLAAAATRIVINGRTSNDNSTEGSIWVATERAESVKRHLLDLGFPGELITINVMGSGDFIANNQTKEGRKKNRRADVRFLFEGKA